MGAAPIRVLIASFDHPALPCARIRLLDPLACCRGVEVRWAVEAQPGGTAFRSDLLEWADLVVTQRGFPRPETRGLLDAIRASRKPVVYEIDDCLPEVPEFVGKPHYREWGPAMLEWAGRVDAVTVPTQPLADYFAPHARRVHVLPNYITGRTRPSSLVSAAGAEGRIEIGYVGNPDHRRDLRLVADALLRALQRRPQVRVTFVGTSPEGFPPHERVSFVRPDYQYDSFPARLAAFGFDFALAPLLDSPFNRCRSHVKYLEYGVLGIPGIFSRCPAYESVRDGVTGVLCDDRPQAWDEAIELFCRDVGLRRRIGEAARLDVRERWMLEPRAHLWPETYSALVNRDSRPKEDP